MKECGLYSNVKPVDGFDWSPYDNGATGGLNLVVNKKVKTKNQDKVYCHNDYAQELYDKMFKYEIDNNVKYSAKDSVSGSSYNVVNIRALSGSEIAVDSDNGMSSVIDMNKEKQYLDAIGCDSVETFMNALKFAEGFDKKLLDTDLTATVCEGGRISLWEGHKAKIEQSLINQIKDPEHCVYAYEAKIREVNNGGYFVDVCGVRCFMPGSLAAAGVITDYESMIGKSVPVMAVNYLPKSGFVVSYKKYLNAILPSRIEKELSVGMEVMCKVTGSMRNGVFVIFKDSNGEWVFSGLVHRSCMSKDFEKSFDRREIQNGDEMRLFISSINVSEDGKYRIVLTDKQPKNGKEGEDE